MTDNQQKIIELRKTAKQIIRVQRATRRSLVAQKRKTRQASVQDPFQVPPKIQASFTGKGLQEQPTTKQAPGEFRPSYPESSVKAIEAVQARIANMAENIRLQTSQQGSPRASQKQSLRQQRLQHCPQQGPSNPGLQPSLGMAPVYKVPTLYPVYFSYASQHALLVAVQSLLEESLFEFTERWMPQLLSHTKWDTATAGELSQWPTELRRYQHQIPPEAIDVSGSKDKLDGIVNDVRELRNIAVHREPKEAVKVLSLLRRGLVVTKSLKDTTRSLQLEKILELASLSQRELESGKDVLEDKLAENLQKLQNERDKLEVVINELDEKARRAVATTKDDDIGMKSLLSKLLEDAIKLVLAPSVGEKGTEALAHKIHTGGVTVESFNRELLNLKENICDEEPVSDRKSVVSAEHAGYNNDSEVGIDMTHIGNRMNDQMETHNFTMVWHCKECNCVFKTQTALADHMSATAVHHNRPLTSNYQDPQMNLKELLFMVEDIKSNNGFILCNEAGGLSVSCKNDFSSGKTIDTRLEQVSKASRDIDQNMLVASTSSPPPMELRMQSTEESPSATEAEKSDNVFKKFAKQVVNTKVQPSIATSTRSFTPIGTRVVTLQQRGISLVDLTLDDETVDGEEGSVNDNKPQIFLRKRKAPVSEQLGPSKRQKLEEVEPED